MPLLWHIYCRFILCLLLTPTNSTFGIDMFIACFILNLFRALLGHVFKPEAFRKTLLWDNTLGLTGTYFSTLQIPQLLKRDVDRSMLRRARRSCANEFYSQRSVWRSPYHKTQLIISRPLGHSRPKCMCGGKYYVLFLNIQILHSIRMMSSALQALTEWWSQRHFYKQNKTKMQTQCINEENSFPSQSGNDAFPDHAYAHTHIKLIRIWSDAVELE